MIGISISGNLNGLMDPAVSVTPEAQEREARKQAKALRIQAEMKEKISQTKDAQERAARKAEEAQKREEARRLNELEKAREQAEALRIQADMKRQVSDTPDAKECEARRKEAREEERKKAELERALKRAKEEKEKRPIRWRLACLNEGRCPSCYAKLITNTCMYGCTDLKTLCIPETPDEIITVRLGRVKNPEESKGVRKREMRVRSAPR